MENLVGRKAKVVDGFETNNYLSGTHCFEEGEIVTLTYISEEGGELWYHFTNEDRFRQALIESEFEFIEEGGK